MSCPAEKDTSGGIDLSGMDRLLTLREAASLLAMHPRTLYDRTRRGDFKFVRLPGSKRMLYRLSTLKQLIEEQERQLPRT